MDKIFDLLDLYEIGEYCEVTCTPDLIYKITFKYKDYYTVFSFFDYEFNSPGYLYYIDKIISNLSDIVKVF